MRINKIEISNSQVNYVEMVSKIEYSPLFGIDPKLFNEIKEQILKIPEPIIQSIILQTNKANNERSDKKRSVTLQNIKEQLVSNGVSILNSISASALFEILKNLIS
ncbi:MAG: hypothetical protein HOO86_09035 [Bacteroidales bacterium]|nr:hypothetical protein [Bacteroidales bacterium]